MANNLDILCDHLGIDRFFSANFKDIQVSESLLREFCRKLGYPASNDEEVQYSLQLLNQKKYQDTVAPIYVVRENCLEIEIRLTGQECSDVLELRLSSFSKKCFQKQAFEVFETKNQTINNVPYQIKRLRFKENLKIGYYHLEITVGKKVYETVLVVAPEKCLSLKELNAENVWGFSLQLYSLKSRRNWGIGDFTDLQNFASIAFEKGADVIGLNPLNAPFHDFPENASPYASISRLFLNPIYIDVEKTEGFNDGIKKKYASRIKAVQKTKLIDYTNVYNLKIEVLNELFKKNRTSKAFVSYQKESGESLRLFAVYQSIYSNQCHKVWGGWRAWPNNFQNQNPMDMLIFEQTHHDEIEFFEFLQFEAHRQLMKAAEHIQSLGMKIGLYRDLPVGVCKDSAEVWADRYNYVQGFGAGAPPDAFFQTGQKWCLAAFHPIKLKENAYQPFIRILRANMKFAGALRMDHVMSLMRLFMIEDEGEKGTYMHYCFDDMLSLVALESHLNKCVIVGESIGNVPDGFVEKIHQNGIYSMSVLWGERFDCGMGDFKGSSYYPSEAFVSVGTHDMPPLKMWWFGYEIELKYKLKMIDENERQRLYKEREADRWRLLKVLDENDVWPKDHLRKGNYLYGEGYPEGIDEAVHSLLGKSKSKVVIMQPEDALEVDELQNLPGTDCDKYPNWRHKLPVFLEDLKQNETFLRNINALNLGRKSQVK